jgi:hypothetical protein
MSSSTVAGKKYDAGKLPTFRGLVSYFPRALAAIASISRYGADKYEVPYEDQNWARVDNAENRYRDAASRHEFKEVIEGFLDPESGEPHLAHRAWNVLATLELLLRRLEDEEQNNHNTE